MKYFTSPICLLLLYFSANLSIAQELKQELDNKYNWDPILYNGIIFTNNYKRSVEGSQFFEENTFRKNDLRISNTVFDDQYINYDVYSQKLLLTYLDEHHAQKMVEIPIENIQHFSIGDKYFEVQLDPDNTHKIYQVYQCDDFKIMIYWTKYMKQNSGAYTYRYRFSTIQKQIWLFSDNQYYRIKKNKDFINQIPENLKSSSAEWMNSSKFKIQKADDSAFKNLVNHLNKP